jgi:hypothetical protein
VAERSGESGVTHTDLAEKVSIREMPRRLRRGDQDEVRQDKLARSSR